MKLTTFTILSADGVMQGLGGPDEDPSGGFERGGWALPLFDDDEMTLVNEVYQRADAFLFGRRTYEIFVGSWGAVVEPDTNTIAAALNTKPKYVASTTLTEPRWANTTVLSDDIGAAIGELKAEREGELQVHGSGRLVRWLFANELVDEIILLTAPVIVGRGTRLFPDVGPASALDLVDSRATSHGVTMQAYRSHGAAAVRDGQRRDEGRHVGAMQRQPPVARELRVDQRTRELTATSTSCIWPPPHPTADSTTRAAAPNPWHRRSPVPIRPLASRELCLRLRLRPPRAESRRWCCIGRCSPALRLLPSALDTDAEQGSMSARRHGRWSRLAPVAARCHRPRA